MILNYEKEITLHNGSNTIVREGNVYSCLSRFHYTFMHPVVIPSDCQRSCSFRMKVLELKRVNNKAKRDGSTYIVAIIKLMNYTYPNGEVVEIPDEKSAIVHWSIKSLAKFMIEEWEL